MTCAWGIENLGYVGIVYGVCDAFAAYCFGTVVRYTGRIPVVIFAALLNLGTIITLFNWQPNPESFWLFFAIAGIWGIADAIWQTQFNCIVLYCIFIQSNISIQSHYMLQSLVSYSFHTYKISVNLTN